MGGEAFDLPITSEGSVPQGDPIAMAGMAMVLLFPARRAAVANPGALLSVYADDRNAVAGEDEEMDG
eukprot:3527616-Alexandrium_andersonii.AAC.1